jgi:STE24 endopeptidase
METWVTKAFLLFLISKSLIEAVLDLMNKNYINRHRGSVPAKFEGKITLSDHQKAADYTVTKLNVSQFFNLISLAILLVWTLGGGLEALDHLSRNLASNDLMVGVTFFLLFGGISMFLALPQSLYTTFVIEERFGFNKMTLGMFFKDTLKGLILGALLGVPLLFGVLWIMQKLGAWWWLYAWAFFTLFQLALVWIFPTWIAPLFNKFSPLEEGEAKNKILELLENTQFQSNGLFVMDASTRSSHGNAYFTGFGKNKRIVLFDTLIKSLEPEEIKAVLAHELGHFKRRHILKGMIRSFVFSLIGFAILGWLKNWQPFYLGHGLQTMSDHGALLLFALVAGNYTFFMTPLSAWTSRRYEFEADAFAAQYAKAQALQEALVKLYKDNASSLTPHPTYSAYYHSHPPALVRMEHLDKL